MLNGDRADEVRFSSICGENGRCGWDDEGDGEGAGETEVMVG